MSYLVTGGGGFIGSNLTEALLRRGESVRVLDDFSTGRRSNLAEAESWAREGDGRFELLEGDLRDAGDLGRALEGVEVVLHQAAIPSVARSVDDPMRSHSVNVDGTLKLLLACRDVGVRRLVFASSSSVYGDTPTLPKVETMPTAPISPYALDKLAAETYCRLFYQLYGLQTVALRYFNVFGPRQDPGSEYSAVIPKFIAMMSRGERPTINGDGHHSRDFTYIENVVAANLAAVEAPEGACGQAFNAATNRRISLLDLVDGINRELGTSIEPEHGPPRPGDVMHSLADIDKARDLLGYAPQVDIEEGLRRTIRHLTDEVAAPA